jgi:hypothetical protein
VPQLIVSRTGLFQLLRSLGLFSGQCGVVELFDFLPTFWSHALVVTLHCFVGTRRCFNSSNQFSTILFLFTAPLSSLPAEALAQAG